MQYPLYLYFIWLLGYCIGIRCLLKFDYVVGINMGDIHPVSFVIHLFELLQFSYPIDKVERTICL